ncbi:MAG: CBS domain-containing protein [Nanobdellota archaeon]
MILVKDWMSKPVNTVKKEESAFKAVENVAEEGIGDVVVVDDDNNPIGIVTERDIINRLLYEKRDPDKTRIEDIMTRDIKTVDKHTPLLKVSRLMKEGNFRRIPVTDKNKLAGIITSRDLVHFMSL